MYTNNTPAQELKNNFLQAQRQHLEFISKAHEDYLNKIIDLSHQHLNNSIEKIEAVHAKLTDASAPHSELLGSAMQMAISNRRHLQSSIAHHAKGASTHKQNLRRLAMGVFAVLGLAPAAFGSGLEGQQTNDARAGDAMATVVTASNTAAISSAQIKSDIDIFYQGGSYSNIKSSAILADIKGMPASMAGDREDLIRHIWSHIASDSRNSKEAFSSHVIYVLQECIKNHGKGGSIAARAVLSNEQLIAISEALPLIAVYVPEDYRAYLEESVPKVKGAKSRAEFERNMGDFNHLSKVNLVDRPTFYPIVREYFDLAVKHLTTEPSNTGVLDVTVQNLVIELVAADKDGKTDNVDMLFNLANDQTDEVAFECLYSAYLGAMGVLEGATRVLEDPAVTTVYKSGAVSFEPSTKNKAILAHNKAIIAKLQNLVERTKEAY